MFDWIVPLLLFLINHTRENLKNLSSTPACCFRPTVWIPTGNARGWGFKHWTHAKKLYGAPWWVMHPICIFRGLAFQHPALAQLCVHVRHPLTFLQINLPQFYQHLADPRQGAHNIPTWLGEWIQEAGDWKACGKPGCRKQIECHVEFVTPSLLSHCLEASQEKREVCWVNWDTVVIESNKAMRT